MPSRTAREKEWQKRDLGETCTFEPRGCFSDSRACKQSCAEREKRRDAVVLWRLTEAGAEGSFLRKGIQKRPFRNINDGHS